MKNFFEKGVTRAIVALLIVAIVAGVVAGLAIKVRQETPEPEPDFTFMVISDIHVLLEEQVGDYWSQEYQDFDAFKTGKMEYISQCIFSSAMDKVIEKHPDALIATGDYSDIGAKIGQEFIASEFRRVEKAGIQVIMVLGNHDIESDRESFTYANGYKEKIEGTDEWDCREIYAEFGYDEALVRDTETTSYTIDFGDRFRIISIDAYRTNEGKNEYLLGWVEEQTKQAVADGKTPIGICHYPILNHFGNGVGAIAASATNITDSTTWAKTLLKSGMHYTFTGHLHNMDTQEFSYKTKTEDYGTLYDFETCSLANYPCGMRVVKQYGDELKFSSYHLEELNPDYIPSYVPAEDREAMLSNFQLFAENFMERDFMAFLYYDIFPDAIPVLFDVLGLDIEQQASQDLYDKIINTIKEIEKMPMYNKDAKAGEETLESVCAKFGVSIPASKYTSIPDLAFRGYNGPIQVGDENITCGCTEDVLLRYSIFYAIYKIDAVGLFDDIHAINPSVPALDLSIGLEQLFQEQKLEVVDNDLIAGIINSIAPLKEVDMLSGLLGLSSQDTLDAAAQICETMDLGALIKSFLGVRIDVGKYIDAPNGTLDIGGIFDDVLYGVLGEGVLYDSVPDNNFTIDLINTKMIVEETK